MSEWQPIETAPRDGSHVLLCELIKTYDDDFNDYQYWYKYTGFYVEERDDFILSSKWRCAEYDAFDRNPKYWQPLPNDPE
jgi:hypothetical protein